MTFFTRGAKSGALAASGPSAGTAAPPCAPAPLTGAGPA